MISKVSEEDKIFFNKDMKRNNYQKVKKPKNNSSNMLKINTMMTMKTEEPLIMNKILK